MKKLFITSIIVILAMVLLTFTPLIMAEENVVATKPAPIPSISLDSINTPIHDGLNNYMYLDNPRLFATHGDFLAVLQGNDIHMKMGSTIKKLLGAGSYIEGETSYPLKSITIEPIQSFGNNEFYIFLSYPIMYPSYKTIIYRVNFGMDNKKLTFGEYFKDKGVNGVSESIISILDSSVSEICYSAGNVYAIANKDGGGIYKITYDSVSKLKLKADENARLTTINEFTVGDNDEMFIYGFKDNNSSLLKMRYDANIDTNSFSEVATYDNIIDIKASGNFLYLLSQDKIMVSNTAFDKPNNILYEMKLNEGERAISMDINVVSDITYAYLTIVDNPSILTYKQTTKDGIPSFYARNHIGSNCTCETPHEGWLNKPTKIAMASQGINESIVYVVENNDNRLSVLSNVGNKKTYSHYFYNASEFALTSIHDVAIDNKHFIYLASGNRLYKYKNEGIKDSEKPILKRQSEIDGFDGDISSIYINNNDAKSKLYILTSKNSIYSMSEDETRPTLIKTFDEKIVSIAPSYDNKKIYVSTDKTVKSYSLDNVDSVLTTLTIDDENIVNIDVDYVGTIFMATTDNLIRAYQKTSDTSYELKQSLLSRNNTWQGISDFYIIPSSKTLITADSSTHLVQKVVASKWFYQNSEDKYIDNNIFMDEPFVGKLNADSRAYIAPKNYEMYEEVKAGDYYYILAVDESNPTMYQAVDSNNNIKYLKRDNILKINPTNESNIGTSFKPLHGSVKVYPHPFIDKNGITSAPIVINTPMEFVNNVAFDNGIVWQNDTTRWYKVSYNYNQNGTEGVNYGYVQMSEITKNKSTKAPATKKFLRVTTDNNDVNLYDMNNLASGILAEKITDGTLVMLLGDTFDTSSEFTYVRYEDENGKTYDGYILTKHLQENTFTQKQIIAIVATSITLVITILVVVLIVVFKKKKDNINSFKSNDK